MLTLVNLVNLILASAVCYPPFERTVVGFSRRKIMTSKVVILVDGAYFDNLNYYLRDKKDKKLSLERLSEKIVGDKTHLRTKYYNAYPYQSEKPTQNEKDNYRRAQNFFYTINGYKNHEFSNVGRVRLKPCKCPYCNKEYEKPEQKGVDVGLALDLVKMARKRVADEFAINKWR